MSLSISNMKAAISKNPLLDPTKYKVQINGPAGTLDESISLLCSSVVLPGRSFSAIDKYHHGPIRKVPYEELYSEVTLNFYETMHMKEKKYFNEWQQKIGSAGGEGSYYIGWYEDIIGTVTIITMDKQGNDITETTLYEAYPITIGDSTLAYDSGDTIAILPVIFVYHHWEKK